MKIVVAGQGTAFGLEQIEGLKRLGVRQVFIGFDADEAGQEAASKVGNLFQREGVEVFIVEFPKGKDPDAVLRKEGIEGISKRLKSAKEYLSFLVKRLSKEFPMYTPFGKHALVQKVKEALAVWKHPIMVYEAEKTLANFLSLPMHMVQLSTEAPSFEKKEERKKELNPNQILETDLLRWLILCEEDRPFLLSLIQNNLSLDDFIDPQSKKLYNCILGLSLKKKEIDLLTLASFFKKEESGLFDCILEKKIQIKKAVLGAREAIEKILQRNWMLRREAIKTKIQMGDCSEEEILQLVKQFDRIKKEPPVIKEVL